MLLPLLLQPLVENAINHGLESKPDGGHLRISASVADGALTIQVLDNGLGLAAPKHRARHGNGLALKNIRERLAARYDDGAALDLDLTDTGCCATLRLPLEKDLPQP
jgi:sensor histidine kinase YesM